MTEERHVQIDAETLAGKRFPYQEDISLIEDVDLLAATPGADINWLEDVELLGEEGVPAVFDRYSNSFLRIYFPIPEGRENEIARKVLIKHLQSGNSYGIQLKAKHCKFPQPELGSWVPDSATVGDRLEGAGAGGLGGPAALTPPASPALLRACACRPRRHDDQSARCPARDCCDFLSREDEPRALRARDGVPDRQDRARLEHRHVRRHAVSPLRGRGRPGPPAAVAAGGEAGAASCGPSPTTGRRSAPRRSPGSTCAAGRCSSRPAGTGTGGATRTVGRPSVPQPDARGRGRCVDAGAALVGDRRPRDRTDPVPERRVAPVIVTPCCCGSAPASRSSSTMTGPAAVPDRRPLLRRAAADRGHGRRSSRSRAFAVGRLAQRARTACAHPYSDRARSCCQRSRLVPS